MGKLTSRFWELNIWVKIVLCCCAFGALASAGMVGKDFAHNGILLRLHLGFFILYTGQVVFILCHERLVWVLAALQGFMALLTTADFTFMPLVRFVGNVIYMCWPDPSIEYDKVYRYLLISAAFTLQMLSAYILFSLLPAATPQKDVSSQPNLG